MTMRNHFGMLGAAAIAAGLLACGGGVTTTHTRESARDAATKAACDRYNTCGAIGPAADDAYVSYDSCSIDWLAVWEQRWPPGSCPAINAAGLNVCLSAISATDCTNLLDLLATLAKCEAIDVCMSATPDGG
jgi:hypothetical protein